MRILYFCEEYFCNYGARTHGREFFGALKSLPEVNYGIVMSRWNKPTQDNENIIIRKKQGKGRFTFLSPALHKFLSFFRPRPEIAEKIIGQIAQENIDILIVRSGNWNIPYGKIKKAFPNLILCVEINAFVFDEHFHNLLLRSLWQNLEVKLLSKADCFIVVASYLRDYLTRRGIEKERILVNPNGVNTELFNGINKSDRNIVRAELEIPEKAFVLGYIGGMEPFRRLPEMVEAVADLRRQGENDIYLLIIGDGEQMPLVNQSISKNSDTLQGWVSCLGWQPYEQLPKLMASFDLAVLPFTNPYCSPLKIFEYLAMELPTIGPDIPSVRETFEDGKHLLLVSQDRSVFQDAIITLKKSQYLRTLLAMNGRERVINTYTWFKNAKRVLDHTKRFSRAQ
jgi:glycosyltransferase involved in cell wall biosynthesis